MCKRIKTQELKGKCKRAYIDLVCRDETIGASSNQNPCPKLEQKKCFFLSEIHQIEAPHPLQFPNKENTQAGFKYTQAH